MDYQIALEVCRAYKACHVRLRQLGMNAEADDMQAAEEKWRAEYVRLANKQQAETDVE